jgi:hypothetical protein
LHEVHFLISLEIPRLAAEHVIPRDYVKPDIMVGNYYLKWDDSSYGIGRREAPELRSLINDLLPYISSAIYEAAKEIHTAIEENAKGAASRRIEALSPELLLTRRSGDITYTLQMKRDGATLLRRSETIIVDDGAKKKTQLAVSWILGELLFNRQKDTHN